METVTAYTDGSFKKGKASWAFIILKNNKIIHRSSGVLEGKINCMNQIGGELKACVEVLRYCIKKNLKCTIFADYLGCRMWVADLWDHKPWICKNPWTKKYREIVLKNKKYLEEIKHIRGHSGDFFNEFVDKIASEAFNKKL